MSNSYLFEMLRDKLHMVEARTMNYEGKPRISIGDSEVVPSMVIG